jgi:hypothetical protein
VTDWGKVYTILILSTASSQDLQANLPALFANVRRLDYSSYVPPKFVGEGPYVSLSKDGETARAQSRQELGQKLGFQSITCRSSDLEVSYAYPSGTEAFDANKYTPGKASGQELVIRCKGNSISLASPAEDAGVQNILLQALQAKGASWTLTYSPNALRCSKKYPNCVKNSLSGIMFSPPR